MLSAGIFSQTPIARVERPGFFNSGTIYKMSATDPDFMKFLFHKHKDSGVIHFPDLKLIETKLVNNKETEVTSDIEMPKSLFHRIFG